MPALPPLTFKGGLNTNKMEAGPNDLVECKNIFWEDGTLYKRGGGSFDRYVNTNPSGFGTISNKAVGFGTAAAVPTSVATTGPISAGAGKTRLYVGAFYSFGFLQLFNSANSKAATLAALKTAYAATTSGSTIEYWNGTTWAPLSQYSLSFAPEYSSSCLTIAPFFPVNQSGSYGSEAATGLTTNAAWVFVPPEDWVQSTIALQTLYWLRIGIGIDFNASDTVDVDQSNFYTQGNTPQVNGVERRDVKRLLYFKDRNNATHEFVAQYVQRTGFQSGDIGFQLDGATLTQSDGLQPDVYPGLNGPYTKVNRVFAYYSPPTDRIVGLVEGGPWFFCIPNGADEIYNFKADIDGANTPYQSLPGGLRGTIPPGPVTASHDNRLWSTFGPGSHRVAYSAPGVYIDIWPNDFEIDVSDDAGAITGMASLNSVLVVFKAKAAYVVYPSGDADGYQYDRVPGNIGCIAQESITVIGNQCFFLAEDGIYVFDGTSVRRVSEKIQGLINSRNFSARPDLAKGVYYAPFNQYRLFFPSTDFADICDAALYVDVSSIVSGGDNPPAFWPQGPYSEDYPNGFYATAVAIDSTTSRPRMMVGDANGCVWQHDSGTKDPYDPTGVGMSFKTSRIGLGGSRRNLVRFVTPTQNSESMDSQWSLLSYVDGDYSHGVTEEFTAQGDNADAAFYGTTATVSTGQLYDELMTPQALRSGDMRELGRYIQFEVEHYDDVPWSLEGMEISVTPYGRGLF